MKLTDLNLGYLLFFTSGLMFAALVLAKSYDLEIFYSIIILIVGFSIMISLFLFGRAKKKE